jgi:hypothetical protein
MGNVYTTGTLTVTDGGDTCGVQDVRKVCQSDTQCDGEGQVQKQRKSVTKGGREHSVHGAGLGVEGDKVSEPPRTLAIDFSL